MNLRTIMLLLVAVSVAGLTAIFARNWLASQRAALEAQAPAEQAVAAVDVIEVLVAERDLPTGTFIRAAQLKWQPWPEDAVTDGYVVKGEAAASDFEGAVVRSHLYAGEPITEARLVHAGERGFLAAVLEPGKRAVSVPVNATTGISGFIFPGDVVDVLLTLRITVNDPETKKGHPRHFSETLLRNVRVLAIDQQVENDEGTAKVAKTATLEVGPKQAEKISLALQLGSLSLSLRSLAVGEEAPTAVEQTGNGSAERSYTRDLDVYYMLGDPSMQPIPGSDAVGGPGRTVFVLHGEKVEEMRF